MSSVLVLQLYCEHTLQYVTGQMMSMQFVAVIKVPWHFIARHLVAGQLIGESSARDM